MIIIYVLIVLSSSIVAFINVSPQFGSNPNSKQKQFYSTFPNYMDGEFKNLEQTIMVTSDMPMTNFFKRDSNRVPSEDLIPNIIDIEAFRKNDDNSIKFSWLGHSAFLFNINGKIIMLDPMLGKYAAPIPIPTLRRYHTKIALSFDDLDSIDAVIFSHDHYDHLDYSTVKKLKNKVKKYFVPLGLGNHLISWGIKEELIIELNWNQIAYFDEMELICLPSRHFSGRGLYNRNSTLWASWAIISKYGKIYFSGDSGYGEHFGKIGEQFGPFDLTLIDCGQYNRAWKHSHMFPKEAIVAAQDLGSDYFMPIHWGAFTLSTHTWTEPIEGALLYAKKYNQKIIAPELGQIVLLNNVKEDIHEWWKN